MITYILIFFSVALVDVFWTRYFQSVAEKAPVKSGVYSSLIILIGAFSTMSYVGDHKLVIPAALGAFVGTYFTVKTHKE
jgi:hypothetical protein